MIMMDSCQLERLPAQAGGEHGPCSGRRDEHVRCIAVLDFSRYSSGGIIANSGSRRAISRAVRPSMLDCPTRKVGSSASIVEAAASTSAHIGGVLRTQPGARSAGEGLLTAVHHSF